MDVAATQRAVRLEQPRKHSGLVGGSNPSGPTISHNDGTGNETKNEPGARVKDVAATQRAGHIGNPIRRGLHSISHSRWQEGAALEVVPPQALRFRPALNNPATTIPAKLAFRLMFRDCGSCVVWGGFMLVPSSVILSAAR